MLIYPQTGMVYSEQLLNNMLDQYALLWIKMYYWPYFLAGNMDNIKEIMGMSLNGFKPMCAR